MDRAITRIAVVFSLIGLACIGGAAFMVHKTTTFLRSSETAAGTIVHVYWSEGTGSPVVQFALPSGELQRFTTSWSSSMPGEVGDEVVVHYDPENPDDARTDGVISLWGFPLIFGFLGTVSGTIGVTTLAVGGGRKRKEAELRLRGRRVQARFQTVERNTSLEVNGRHPWRILCQWQDPATGLLHVFKSQNLWFDPTRYVQVQELTVFVDPANPKRYVVDVGFLPKLAA